MRKELTQADSRYFPTYYAMGGQWGFTCTYCKQFQFGWHSKAETEGAMLSHYDTCDAFRKS